MRSKSFIAVAVFLVMLLAGSVAVYAYDTGRDDVIAEGVRISGVDVGGLEVAEARERVRAALVEPLDRPVIARHRGRKFTLTPERARVGVNVDASVAEALRRSREGGFLGRTVRNLTGGTVDASVDVDITYDEDAVARVVRRAQKALDREAVDADVSFAGGDVSVEESRTGRRVLARRLERKLTRRLTATTGTRTVKVPTRVVEPEVTTAEVAEKYPTVIIVNRNTFTLRLFKKLEEDRSYRVAVGQAGLETPQGLYEIQNMAVNPAWHVPDSDWAGKLAGRVIPPGPDNPIKARWMGIYDGAGIHGTDAVGSLGTAASHGCIRMAIPDVEELYELVDVGTPVYIV